MDYSKYNKNELEYDYLELDLSREEIMKKYNINSLTSLKRVLNYFNIKKPLFNPNKDDLYNDFIINNLTLEQMACKYKISSSRIQVYLKKYNIKKSQELQEINRKKTMNSKYGGNAPICSNDIKNKIKKTNIEKYGVENPFANKDIQEKIQKTNLNKYGVINPMFNKEIHEKAMEVAWQTNLEKYGVEYACLLDNCMQATNGSMKSSINENFAKKLTEANILFEREYRIDIRSYDFKINNTLIELDPTITHNSTKGYKSREPLSKTYHKEKSELAELNGFHCIHIFDWDVGDKIISLIKPKETIYARECEIKFVDNIDEFLNINHIQGTCKGQTIKIGLYYNNILVEVMTFGKPRYNKNYEYELLRLCTDNNYVVIGGANKIFQYFLKTYNPKSIISYCDMAKFSGKVYDILGFKLKRKNQPTKHWYNKKLKLHYTDTFIRQHGVDQIFKTSYGKNTSNDELMRSMGFLEVYDCGQNTYVYNTVE